jgi:Ferritin-like domain
VNRRGFLVGAAGAGAATLGGPWLTAAQAAPEEDLAFVNFAASAELLLADFYTKALASRVFPGPGGAALRGGRLSAREHGKALAQLLEGAGDVAPVAEDFTFAWPARTFRTSEAAATTGLRVLRAMLGAYQSAIASVTEPTYRVLYAALAASLGQQLATLALLSGRSGIQSFPVAMDLEAASTVLEPYLG